MKAFEEASNIIPIFRGGNFRFNVKSFIDAVVEYAKTCNDNIELIETHYKTKKVPSETAKVADLHCRVCGFKELAEDVIKIAIMMKNKNANGVYDLDRLLKESEN